MIVPIQQAGNVTALTYNTYKDINVIAENLKTMLFPDGIKNEYDQIYIDKASVKFYVYDSFTSLYNHKKYLSDTDLQKLGGFVRPLDKHKMIENLQNHDGYTTSMEVYVNFERYEDYIDIGDINHLAAQGLPVTYFSLKQDIPNKTRGVIYNEIRIPRIPRKLSLINETVKNGTPQENAQCILDLEQVYTRMFSYVYKNIYYPFKNRINKFKNNKCTLTEVTDKNFINAEQFMQLASEKYAMEVKIRVPICIAMPTDEVIPDGDKLKLRLLEQNIDYIDFFNSICLLNDWWVMTRDFYCDAEKMGDEYVNSVNKLNPKLHSTSLLESNITFTISTYDPSNPNNIGSSQSITGTFNIYWWVYEWQKQAKLISMEYDALFHEEKNKTNNTPISAYVCNQMLAEAKYKAFKDYFKEGEYLLTTLLPYENILDVDSSRLAHNIFSGIKVSQYDLMTNKTCFNSIDKMMEQRGEFTLITSRSLITTRIVKIYVHETAVGSNKDKKYLADMEINFYSEGKKYDCTLITIDIDKWYSLPFFESEHCRGTDYRISSHILNPAHVFKQTIQQYCNNNSIQNNKLLQSQESAAISAFIMSLIQQITIEDSGNIKTKSYFTPRVGVNKQETIDSNGKHLAYLPNADIYSAFMDLCQYAFKSPFSIKTTEELHFVKYLSNESDIINQGLRFRFLVGK